MNNLLLPYESYPYIKTGILFLDFYEDNILVKKINRFLKIAFICRIINICDLTYTLNSFYSKHLTVNYLSFTQNRSWSLQAAIK